MERDAILYFSGKMVKIVLKNNFILSGLIEEVYSDSLLFKTDRKKSLISFDVISEIVTEDSN
jgi:sRNA-binding regulator protein Hfq